MVKEAEGSFFPDEALSHNNSDLHIVKILGRTFLRAGHTVNTGMQSRLPSNKWQDEMMRLFDTTLAGI